MGTPLMTGLAAIANATMHVGVDSFSNHATHLFNTPAVILWGSTQWSAAGYPNNRNISLGLSCQPCFKEAPNMSIHPKGPCDNPPGQVYEAPKHACMAGISVIQVDVVIKEMWSSQIKRQSV
jgi:ADP-heptose:LPS heptosyltransferase